MLFRSFTFDSDGHTEILKTKKSKAASPRVLKKLDKIDSDDYDLISADNNQTDISAVPQELSPDKHSRQAINGGMIYGT